MDKYMKKSAIIRLLLLIFPLLFMTFIIAFTFSFYDISTETGDALFFIIFYLIPVFLLILIILYDRKKTTKIAKINKLAFMNSSINIIIFFVLLSVRPYVKDFNDHILMAVLVLSIISVISFILSNKVRKSRRSEESEKSEVLDVKLLVVSAIASSFGFNAWFVLEFIRSLFRGLISHNNYMSNESIQLCIVSITVAVISIFLIQLKKRKNKTII
jgi:hypothetical protein